MIEAFGLQLNIKSIHMFLSPSAHKKDKEGPRSLVFPHEDPRKRDRTPTRWLSLTAAKFTKCLSVFAGMRRVNYYVKHLIQASYTSESRTKLAEYGADVNFLQPMFDAWTKQTPRCWSILHYFAADAALQNHTKRWPREMNAFGVLDCVIMSHLDCVWVVWAWHPRISLGFCSCLLLRI